jgi:S1-C subfamily serine protease
VGVAQVVAGGPAAKAGLLPGDVIVAVNGTQTPTTSALTEALAQLSPGTTVTVTYERDGARHTAKVTLGQLPGS